MKNLVQDGKVLTLAAPYDRLSGEGVKVGIIFGVCGHDALTGANVEVHTEGVYQLTKVGSQAWTVGASVYWDDTNKRCTTVATSNLHIGKAVEAVGAGAGETLGKVWLTPGKDVVG